MHSDYTNSKREKRQREFLARAHLMYGEGHYVYPHLADELDNLESEISIFCLRHKHLFICPAKQHVHARTDKRRKTGRGCPECKKDHLRNIFRKPFSEVLTAYKKLGLEILSDESSYKNTSSILLARCQNNHEFKSRVSKALYRKQGCPNCGRLLLLGEEITRHLMEAHFGCTFTKQRFTPKDKKHQYLELDGYNEEHLLAFEYQGAYHSTIALHKSKEHWLKQLERDKATRSLCRERGIHLVEVQKYGGDTFDENDVLHGFKSAILKAGFQFKADKIPDIKEIISKIIGSSGLLDELDKIVTEHNLTLLSERIWKGTEFRHLFKCNACGYEFLSSVASRKNAKHKCCPQCARKKGAPSAAVTRQRKKEKVWLKSFRTKVANLGVTLTSENWQGSGYDNNWEGTCNCCGQPVPKFCYNKVLKKKTMCPCQFKRNPPSRRS